MERQTFHAGDLWTPIFNLGDCIIFDGFTIHRTFTPPRNQFPRISLEARSFSASKPKPEFFKNNELLRVDITPDGDYQMTYIGQKNRKTSSFATPTNVTNYYYQQIDREVFELLRLQIKNYVFELLKMGFQSDSVLISLSVAYLTTYNKMHPENAFNIPYWLKHIFKYQEELLSSILQFIEVSSSQTNFTMNQDNFEQLKSEWANILNEQKTAFESLKQGDKNAHIPFDKIEFFIQSLIKQEHDLDSINQSIMYIWLQFFVFAYAPNPDTYPIIILKWESIYYHIQEHFIAYLKRR